MNKQELLLELSTIYSRLHSLENAIEPTARQHQHTPLKAVLESVITSKAALSIALQEEGNLLTFYNDDLTTIDLSMDWKRRCI
jgi:hypothetical protein